MSDLLHLQHVYFCHGGIKVRIIIDQYLSQVGTMLREMKTLCASREQWCPHVFGKSRDYLTQHLQRASREKPERKGTWEAEIGLFTIYLWNVQIPA